MNTIGAANTSILYMNNGAGSGSSVVQIRGGTFRAWGATKTPYSLLVGNVSAGATSLTVADATGWNNGDSYFITPTSRANLRNDSQWENAYSFDTITSTPYRWNIYN